MWDKSIQVSKIVWTHLIQGALQRLQGSRDRPSRSLFSPRQTRSLHHRSQPPQRWDAPRFPVKRGQWITVSDLHPSSNTKADTGILMSNIGPVQSYSLPLTRQTLLHCHSSAAEPNMLDFLKYLWPGGMSVLPVVYVKRRYTTFWRKHTSFSQWSWPISTCLSCTAQNDCNFQNTWLWKYNLHSVWPFRLNLKRKKRKKNQTKFKANCNFILF